MVVSIQMHDNTFLSEDQFDRPFVLLVLNGHGIQENVFRHLWDHAQLKICADGGANRIYDQFTIHEPTKYIPHVILGDLDSLRDDVRDFYSTTSCQILRQTDQNSNDMDKCLAYVANYFSSQAIHQDENKDDVNDSQQMKQCNFDCVAVGALGGRFDQTLQNCNALFKWKMANRFILLSKSSLVEVLSPGHHRIQPNFLVEGRTCGILPLGKPCRSITTQGFRWNLKNTRSEFGGLVSSSNWIEDNSVILETSDELLWTNELI